MNEEKLIWGAGFIDDDLVSEAIDYKPRRIRLAPWACAAAAAVVLVTAVAIIAGQIGKTPVLPPDSSGIVASTGLPQYTTDPEYTAGTRNWSLPNNPPDYSKSPNNSTDTSMSTVTTIDIDPEPQPVDIGNGMTLVGTPLDASKLEDYPLTFNTEAWELDSAAEEFIDSLEIPELKKLIKRELRLTAYCLSPMTVSFTSAVPTNGSVYIRNADGVRYYETGYTYESFYNEYLRTFTKETLEEMFQKYDVFLDYNGELFCSDGSRGGQVGVVRREYELISKSDTVIEFRELIFYKDNDDKPASEYVPELRDEYDLGVIDFKFVLTEDGWRAANIPVEYETELSGLNPSGDGKAYSAIFEEFYPENPATYGPPPTCEEIMNNLMPNPDYPENDVDSYYLIEVIKVLPSEIYTLIRGESTGSSGNTLYEALLIEDLISGEKLDRKAYIEIPAGLDARVQLKGDPTYAPGEKFTAALTKPRTDWNDIYSTGYDLMKTTRDYALRYDLPEMNFTSGDTETMLYYRGRGLARQPIDDFPFETEEISIETAKSTTQNPATYIQKITISDLVEFLREQWQQAGISTHYEN